MKSYQSSLATEINFDAYLYLDCDVFYAYCELLRAVLNHPHMSNLKKARLHMYLSHRLSREHELLLPLPQTTGRAEPIDRHISGGDLASYDLDHNYADYVLDDQIEMAGLTYDDHDVAEYLENR